MTSPRNNIDTYLGFALKEHRVIANKSLKDIGNYIGVSFQQMQKYEKGVNKLSGNYIFQISKYLNTPVEKFFPNSSQYELQENQKVFESNSIRDSELTNLIKNYSAIKQKEIRKKVLDLLKALADC